MRGSEVQNDILVDLLIYGDDKAGNVSRRTNRPASSISRAFSPLQEDGLVSDKGGGVYHLTTTGSNMARNILKSGHNPYLSD